MLPSEDNDMTELSEALTLGDELQNGGAALWRRMTVIKLSLADSNRSNVKATAILLG
jgi:hypothetical protein